MIQYIALKADGAPVEPVQGPVDILAQVRDAYAALHREHPFEVPWGGYLCVVGGQCVGTCGYKSPPQDNRVEIAYFTFPGFEGRGYATAMARHLVELASQTVEGIRVTAQTLPETNASTRILRKLGFTRTEDAHDPDVGSVWEWSLTTAVA